MSAINDEIRNLTKLLNPYKANEFFEHMEIKSVGYMMRYLLVPALFLSLGYALNLYYKAGFESEIKCSLYSSIESALLASIVLIAMVPIASAIISLFSKNLTDRDVSTEEIASIIGYCLGVVMFTGIFRAHVYTIILHYLGIGYGMYLLYTAVSARFGFDKAITVLLFFLIIILMLIMVMSWSLNTFINIVVDVIEFFGGYMSDIPIRKIQPWCF